jgi:hypothetical protein
MNKARMMMIGRGTPINQSKAPLPKPMLASIKLAPSPNPEKFDGFPAGKVVKYFGRVRNGLSILALAQW